MKEKAVNHMNDYYKAIFEDGPYGFMICDMIQKYPEKTFLKVKEVNKNFCVFSGQADSEIIGNDAVDILRKIGWKPTELGDVINQINQTDERIKIQKYHRLSYKYYEAVVFSPRKDLLVISFLEIPDDMRRIEKYNDLLVSICDVAMEFDEEYRITDFCSFDSAHASISRDKVIYKKMEEFLSPEISKQYIKAFKESCKTNNVVEIEYQQKNHPEGYQWHCAEIIAKKDNSNKTVYYAAIYSIDKEKKAELELIKKTERLESFFEILPGLFCIADLKGKFVRFNKAWESMLGYKQEEMMNLNYFDLVHPEDLKELYKEFEDCRSGERKMNLIIRCKSKKGDYCYISWNCHFEGSYFYAVAVNIDELKKIENKLINQKRFLKTLLDAIPDCIFYKDKNGVFLGCNQSTCQAIGRKEEEIIGKTEEELQAPLDRRWQEQEVINSLETKTYEETIYDRNGEYHYIETIKTPFKNQEGAVSGIIGISRDITNHKLAEQKIKESNERFKQLAEHIEEVFWLATEDKILYISPGFEKIWERSRISIYKDNRNFRKYIYCKDKQRVFDALKGKEYRENGHFDEKYRIVKPDGTLRWIWEKVFPIRDENGNIVRRAGLAEDITKIKEAEEAISRTKEEIMQFELKKKSIEIEQLSELDRLRTDFFANLSHELRTPINLIFSALKMVELLNEDQVENKPVPLEKYLRVIKQNSYRLMRLINNLIDVTRLDSGFMTFNGGNWEIVGIVESVSQSVAEYAASKKISLHFETEVPELVISCDPDKIERILLNLLSNAIKFNLEGGWVNISISRTEKDLFVFVTDDGPGIAKDKLRLIFERFKQVDSRLSKAGEGSGIGLSLVKSLVEMHGGHISVDSILGKGTQFIIQLPIKTDYTNSKNSDFENDEREDSRRERIRMEFSDIYGLKF